MVEPTISILLPTLKIGGAERVLLELANGLVVRGWTIQLLLMSKTGPLLREIHPDIEVIDLDSKTYMQVVFALAKHYRRSESDIVLTSIYATGIAAIAAKAFSSYKPKVIVGAHNSLQAKIARPDNTKDKFLLKPLSRLFFPLADGIIAVSKGVAEELEAILNLEKTHVVTIYNPVDKPEIHQLATEAVDHPWLVPRQHRGFKSIVTVGRLVEQKGYDTLIEAFSVVSQSIDCRLIIVGDGPLLPMLKKEAERHSQTHLIDFIGWHTNPHKFVARSDLFVLSSRWEGFAITLVEALAHGCPVVATRCNFGPEEILEDGKYGELVIVGDATDLAEKILASLSSDIQDFDKKEQRRLRALDFTVDSAVDQYEIFFKSVLNESLPSKLS